MDSNQSGGTPPDRETKNAPIDEVIDERTHAAFNEDGATGAEAASSAITKSRRGWRARWKERETLHWPPGKKEWITFIVLALFIGGSVTAWLLTRDKPATIQPIPKVAEGKPTVPSTLTGLPVDPSVNERTVTGVMIENSPAARPQAGLGEAGVIFEAIAEAGITRFLALYQDTAPGDIGPVRSARPYYVQWNLGFDAAYAHVGGSPEALADIKAWNVRDLDQFSSSGAYRRISGRAAPHNVYTSMAALNQLEVEKGYITSKYTGFDRKAKAVASLKKAQPPAKNIHLGLSGPSYNAQYAYDPATNKYLRSMAGAPHIDTNGDKQISPSVVIAMVTPYSLKGDGYHSNYGVVGNGPVYVFQDGNVLTGTWSKADNTSQITFKDAAGKPIKLNPGYTWLTAVAGAGQVNYGP